MNIKTTPSFNIYEFNTDTKNFFAVQSEQK